MLRLEYGRWLLADNGSDNGIYAGSQQVTRVPIEGECTVRLGHPAEGLLLNCELSSMPGGNGVAGESAATVMRLAAQAQQSGVPSPAPSPPAPRDEPLDIPYAVRWLVNIYDLLQVAQPLKPRYYSTSSSPRVHGNGVAHVTVALEATPVPGMASREFRGMSSRYVHGLREGDRVNVFHDSADGFHLQDDVTKPMIFVCAGTGFAPMRAFLWDRLAMRRAGVAMAEAALFNGIRSASQDFIYKDEVEQFTGDGVLDHVHIAASRERPGRRDYVQDRLREQGALLWRLLSAGGYVYVCGSQPMREAVRTAVADVVASHGSLPPAEAETYLRDMETTARYRPDLWV